MAPGRSFRLQGELSNLEPDPSLRVCAWTPDQVHEPQRGTAGVHARTGSVLGAAIGPGSSSQYVAGDYFARRWRLGAYLGRIRWDDGVLYEPIVPQYKRPDVTLYAGVRGGVTWGGNHRDARLLARGTLRLPVSVVPAPPARKMQKPGAGSI